MTLEAFFKTNATQVILLYRFVHSSQGCRGLLSNSKVKHVVFKYSIWTLLKQTELQEWQKKQQLDKYTEAVSCLAHGQMAWKQNLWKIQNIEYFCKNVPPEFPPLWSTVAEMSWLYMSSVSVKTIRGTSIIRNCKIRAPMIVFNTITELWSGF